MNAEDGLIGGHKEKCSAKSCNLKVPRNYVPSPCDSGPQLESNSADQLIMPLNAETAIGKFCMAPSHQDQTYGLYIAGLSQIRNDIDPQALRARLMTTYK